MALIKCDFFSEVLELSTSMTVILPQPAIRQIGMESSKGGEKHQTLFLLHGLTDDHTIWTRRTSLERYAAPLGLAVVMPQVDRSFYTDMNYGNKYWTFLTEELPAVARSFFPLSDKREDNFTAGISMGGYGALKWALNYPEKFAAAASLSGALDIVSRVKESEEEMFSLIFDKENIEGSSQDLFYLIEKLAEAEDRPEIFQCCGTEDFLFEDNQRFQQWCNQLNYQIRTDFEAGEHEWGYWDKKIQEVLSWLPLKER
ncbi:alpha/beta hydrolase [Alkalicoccus daliensis]|uniref:S-formylglutathione hydrolase FrmB n=1 Tax=Alkalicoccus daliensis TaxID=745820 RepID=A0A1H0E454_9BACI|nr:alpha/beta hydrolase family protein [Alkalicoccus daliensis]SDN77214.1 S-formylglutathione hydrolase FrmB [Alkalicoccus daliensis]